jgi:hypothetical protein
MNYGGRNDRSTGEPWPPSPRLNQQSDDRVVVILPQLRNHGEGPTYRGLIFPTGEACVGSIEEEEKELPSLLHSPLSAFLELFPATLSCLSRFEPDLAFWIVCYCKCTTG